MKLKENISLIIGLSIPVLMTLFVAGSIYLPRFFAEGPKYDFVYSTGGDYYKGVMIEGERIVEKEIPRPEEFIKDQNVKDLRLFIYDLKKGESKEITIEESEKLNLDFNTESPDGFEVVCGTEIRGFFIFFFDTGRNCDERQLIGKNVSKELNIRLSDDYYYDNFDFIGWVIK